MLWVVSTWVSFLQWCIAYVVELDKKEGDLDKNATGISSMKSTVKGIKKCSKLH